MSENAKEMYAVRCLEEVFEDDEEEKLDIAVRTLSNHNGTRNRRPGKGHRNH